MSAPMSASQGQVLDESLTQSTPNRDDTLVSHSGDQLNGQMFESSRESTMSGAELKNMGAETGSDQLLPTFSSRVCSHLPTPQSPSNLGPYAAGGMLYTPESPLPHGLSTLGSNQRLEPHKTSQGNQSPPMPRQIMTPESSPLIQRTSSPRSSQNALSRSHSQVTIRTRPSTPRIPPSQPVGLAPAHTIISSRSATPTASSSTPKQGPRGNLSHPFIAKLSITDRSSKTPVRTPAHSAPGSPLRPAHGDDTPSQLKQSLAALMSTPPVSPRPITTLPPPAGGEMERIRQAILQDKLAQYREAESRRPDYLKRARRELNDEPSSILDDNRPIGPGVAILETPQKGRRLTLFQETSEESFEESLMAGGYGRYRTADWVQQPTPLVNPSLAGPSHIVSHLEEEVMPSEKELKKRKRLAAFRGESVNVSSKAKLYPVELEGKGRVLIEVSNESTEPPVSEAAPVKKRGGNRRKKKASISDRESKDKRAVGLSSVGHDIDPMERPNWPDAEFPWRLRTEERAEVKRIEEEERLKWIEKFLDRDSDEEDGEESTKMGEAPWRSLYEEGDIAPPIRRGRGKMAPLNLNPNAEKEKGRSSKKRKMGLFPTDPADARAALLAKKSIRALSYRHQKKQRGAGNENEEEVCICRGKVDARDLVQCDDCKTWYHLQCIGIKSIADLGREEDPWYCRGCIAEHCSTSSSSSDLNMAEMLSSEPTFVPTEEAPRASHIFDTPFFHSSGVEDSPVPSWPRIPRTPTRGGRGSGGSIDAVSGWSSLSGSSWPDSSRHGPSTPKRSSHGARVATNSTPGPFDFGPTFEESPFDPTSTPSRGIRFGPPFATPKTTLWSHRASGLFQTPSKATSRDLAGSNRSFESTGPLDAYPTLPSFDDSPIRRSTGVAERARWHGSKRLGDSPLVRSLTQPLGLEESPVVRVRGKE